MISLPALDTLGAPRILVAGDVILDEYVWGEVSRISPEAPVPVLAGRLRELKAGGAGSVVENLAVLGARVEICGLVGADDAGARLSAVLRERGMNAAGLIESEDRPTIRKTRMIAYVQQANRAQQQVLRVDWEEVRPPSERERARLTAFLAEYFREAPPAAVLVSDYEKGLLDEALLAAIIAHARAARVPVLVDPGRSVRYDRYRGATLVCPNRFEAEQATGVSMRPGAENYLEAGRRLVRDLDVRYAALTLDSEGIYLVQRTARGEIEGRHFPTQVRSITDVAGAGDMVLSMLGIALAAGWSIEEAAEVANVAAGIEVSKVGVTPVERWEIGQALSAAGTGVRSKLATLAELQRIRERARAGNKRVVFANGCFDLLHAGHLALIEHARAAGDLLIIGLNSDASVRRLKGAGRPIHGEMERARILSAIAAIDHIVLFDEDTPMRLIAALTPDMLVKGEDYRGQEVVGRAEVERGGGRVILVPLVPEISTSAILDRIRKKHG